MCSLCCSLAAADIHSALLLFSFSLALVLINYSCKLSYVDSLLVCDTHLSSFRLTPLFCTDFIFFLSINNTRTFSGRLLCLTHIFISLIAAAGAGTNNLPEHLFSAAGRKEVPCGYTGCLPHPFRNIRKNG